LNRHCAKVTEEEGRGREKDSSEELNRQDAKGGRKKGFRITHKIEFKQLNI
jgi:hypothetical protein